MLFSSSSFVPSPKNNNGSGRSTAAEVCSVSSGSDEDEQGSGNTDDDEEMLDTRTGNKSILLDEHDYEDSVVHDLKTHCCIVDYHHHHHHQHTGEPKEKDDEEQLILLDECRSCLDESLKSYSRNLVLYQSGHKELETVLTTQLARIYRLQGRVFVLEALLEN